ncbi:arylesterase monooxygenase [Sporothrix schenckii 1099-18]|uniref:Arylesterase monooxygenase n=1 Tax=Sporothrix schenckii 1099-18 TaxID=1397361 RepID=A0A0F2MEE0_SPOSC|nr:arylesterase monooxygenase [Sporothrix schenckii 1099-18]KJR87444.1 arylesterase monooxygenase [Sporothrix schenckii 1099-18]
MARFAPDYYKAIEPMIKAAESQPPAAPPKNVCELTTTLNALMAVIFKDPPAPAHIVQSKHQIPVPGGRTVAVTRYATAEQRAAKDQPAVIYLHAGGMVCASVDLLGNVIANESAHVGVQYWAVNYTKSPEVAAPVALEEAYAVLTHLSAHAAQLGIDNTRIAVGGASAGGGMAAGLGLIARDRGFRPPIAKLVLVYPMLDDRTVQAHPPTGARHAGANRSDDDWPVRPFLTWSCESNALAWNAYLGLGHPATDDPLTAAANLAKATATAPGFPGAAAHYAIPARAASLAGLPPTYMDCGGLDLFLEECAQFAARLAHDGVELDFHIFHGVPHGFESAPATNAARTAMEQRKLAYNSF